MKLANRLPPPWVIEDENERKREKHQDEGVRLPTPNEPDLEYPPPEEPQDSNESNEHQVVIIDI